MSTPTDPEGFVRAFLDKLGPKAKELPDPFSASFTSPGLISGRALPARLRGLLEQLAEKDREIVSSFTSQREAVTEKFMSRRLFNTTGYDSKLRNLFRNEEAARSSS